MTGWDGLLILGLVLLVGIGVPFVMLVLMALHDAKRRAAARRGADLGEDR